VNKIRVKDNTRGQFQIRLTTPDGTITCVVSPASELARQAERRDAALQLAKRLAQRLEGEIKPPIRPVADERVSAPPLALDAAPEPARRSRTAAVRERAPAS
jgi:hypothetical protein